MGGTQPHALGDSVGDVVVFSGRPDGFPDGAKTLAVRDPKSLAKSNWMKMRVRECYDLVLYERVLFLDSDIAVARPLDRFLHADAAMWIMVGTDNLGHIIGGGVTHHCLEPCGVEVDHQRRAIKTGFHVISEDRAAGWLKVWQRLQRETRHKSGTGWCQSGLNTHRVRGVIPVTLTEGAMWFPERNPRKECCDAEPALVHFHGIGRHLSRCWRMWYFVKSRIAARKRGERCPPTSA